MSTLLSKYQKKNEQKQPVTQHHLATFMVSNLKIFEEETLLRGEKEISYNPIEYPVLQIGLQVNGSARPVCNIYILQDALTIVISGIDNFYGIYIYFVAKSGSGFGKGQGSVPKASSVEKEKRSETLFLEAMTSLISKVLVDSSEAYCQCVLHKINMPSVLLRIPYL